MSTNEDTNVEPINDDLDLFTAQLFGQSEASKNQANDSEEDKNEEDRASDAPNEEDTHSGDDTPENEDEDTEDVEDSEDEASDDVDPEPKPKPKKNRFQERIDELTGKAREAERQKAALEEKIEALLAKLDDKEPTVEKVSPKINSGPQADDLNEDGTDKYPLGEYDPHYIRDLTRFTLEQERLAVKAREQEEDNQRQIDKQRAELQSSWQEKLGPAQERYPDFQERGEELLDTFAGIDQAYGEYLTATLMSMEYGPDVLYYLANNKDEAQKIVNSGPQKATIALGRLEAKFSFANEEKQKARPKVSKAPEPPSHLNKGSAVARPDVSGDTDDLDAFTDMFFKKRRR